MSPARLPSLDLVLAHEPFVRAVARAVLGGDADVDDVVQQTWVAVLGRRPEAGVPARGWVARVARNFARMTLRTRTRRRGRERRAAQPEGLPSTDEIVAREEVRRCLLAAVVGLDEPYRSAVLMRYYQGLGLPAIAERLAVPQETARTRLRRGLERLRERLGAGGDGAARFRALVPWAWGSWTAPSWGATEAAGGLAMKKLLTTACIAVLLAGVCWEAGWGPWRRSREAGRGELAGPATAVAVAPPALLGADRPVERADRADAARLRVRVALVAEATGQPVPGGEVLVNGQKSVLAADGRFELERPGGAPHTVPIDAAAPGFAPRRVQLALPGDGVAEAEVRLARATTIAGTVLDQHGTPVAGAYVYLVREEAARQPSATSDAQGAFSISDAEPLEWTLCVVPPRPTYDWLPVPTALVQGGERALRVELTRLEAGVCALSVRAQDALTSEPVRLARASLFWAASAERGGSASQAPPVPAPEVADGRASAVGLRAGRWRVWGQAEGDGRWGWADVDVAPGARRADVTVRFEAPGTLRGRVDRSQVPAHVRRLFVTTHLVAGWLHPQGATEAVFRMAEAGADGAFELTGMLAGTHRVELEVEGALGAQDVLVPAGGSAEVRLVAQQAGVLRFHSSIPLPEGPLPEGPLPEGPLPVGPPAGPFYVLGLSRGDGPFEDGVLHEGGAGRLLDVRRSVPAGRVRWRLRFPREAFHGSRREAFEPVEGEALLEAGQQLEVHVPLVPRQP